MLPYPWQSASSMHSQVQDGFEQLVPSGTGCRAGPHQALLEIWLHDHVFILKSTWNTQDSHCFPQRYLAICILRSHTYDTYDK